MADLLKMYKICEQCNGTKVMLKRDSSKPEGDASQWVACDNCEGIGMELWGYYEEGGPPG